MAQMEGEKELVLGNKQLISLFFVVVALCGVFFAMGYMMGRPSGKSRWPTRKRPTWAVQPRRLSNRFEQQPEPPREGRTASRRPPIHSRRQPAPIETKPARDTPQPAPELQRRPLPQLLCPEAASPAAGVSETAEGAISAGYGAAPVRTRTSW